MPDEIVGLALFDRFGLNGMVGLNGMIGMVGMFRMIGNGRRYPGYVLRWD